MSTFYVEAVPWEHGWELHIRDVGVTQSLNLHDADEMIRDYIRLDLGETEADRARIVLSFGIDGVDEMLTNVRGALDAASAAQEKAAAASRSAVRSLKAAGVKQKDVAHLMDISPQRVSQLIR